MRFFSARGTMGWRQPLIALMAIAAVGFAGCSGDDGKDGQDGSAGLDGTNCWDLNNNGVGDLPDEDLNNDGVVDVKDCNGLIGGDTVSERVAASKPESCNTCHVEAGANHSAIYESYVDESNLTLSVDSVSSVDNLDGTFDVTTTFTVGGSAFVDIASLNQLSGYAAPYDSATGTYLASCALVAPQRANIVGNNPYTMTRTCNFEVNPATFNGHVYMYVAQTPLFTSDRPGSEAPEDTHVSLYDDQANAALAFGTGQAGAVGAYDSGANVEGCEKCHGTPYLKHGYRAAKVEGIPDFAACKSCHYDDRNGNHADWQYMVDDPLAWATGEAATADYAYKANVKNDTHMSHAMEFPYPMSMYNCDTCHSGKLDDILADENFTATTCKSCHPVQGINAWPETVGDVEEGTYAQDERAPPLEYLWAKVGQEALHAGALANDPDGCSDCHGVFVGGFSDYHTGWDPRIHQADGQKYADLYKVSVDSVTIDGDLMTVEFSANTPDIVPELTVSFYGWDSKHFIVSSHTRGGTDAVSCGTSSSGDPIGCRMEYVPESSGGSANALFTEAGGSAAPNWVVTLDMAAYESSNTDSIPDMILSGEVRKAEVAVAPELKVGDVDVALDAVSETVDVSADGVDQFVDNYFKGTDAVVSEAKCNVCHDQLAATFHSGSGRGGSIVVCRTCHVTTNGGSHLEMQSRSIDSYIHSVHSFQAFDTDDTFEEFDPVFAKRYDQHIKHVFPRFTITNCEACHVNSSEFGVTYNVPDQSKSMPGLLSASYDLNTWYSLDDDDLAVEAPNRSIGTVPEYVTGPASRACGGCHRARLINQDEAGALAAWNSHTDSFGTYVENDSDNDPADQVLYGVIDKIMSIFE